MQRRSFPEGAYDQLKVLVDKFLYFFEKIVCLIGKKNLQITDTNYLPGRCKILPGIWQELVEAPVETMATCVLNCGPPLTEGNSVNK